ncbi:MAG: thiamine pyrophosphate-dependent enzyme, partial [Proteobacteria bacterium]|nr:thiamine pyrophosphate-dependent enzyme [Pseudomonadota bacterium]
MTKFTELFSSHNHQLNPVSNHSSPWHDYGMAYLSRQLAVQARTEVSEGRAGIAILGEGKELAQVAMAKAFQKGDWRSGYYRDQTFMIASGALTPDQFFAQLYADSDSTREPCGGARQALCHYATRFYDQGTWYDQTSLVNVASDVSCTGGQMPRLIGLGYSSKLYRKIAQENPGSQFGQGFSHNGNEVAFGTIGDASTSEGQFWETINAMCVLQIPVAVSVWDNGYGISVPRHLQTAKGSLREVLPGFANTDSCLGLAYYEIKGWDYPALVATYQHAISRCRKEHNPCVIHVTELTQPLGHSSSGNHKLYKSEERLAFEKDYDCLVHQRKWLIAEGIATEDEMVSYEKHIKDYVRESRDRSFKAWQEPFQKLNLQLLSLTDQLQGELDDYNSKTEGASSSIVSSLQELLTSSHQSHESTFASLDHPDIDSDREHDSGDDDSSMAYLTDTDDASGQCYTAKSSHSILRKVLCYLTQLPSPHLLPSLSQLQALHDSMTVWGEQRFRSHLQVTAKGHSPLHVKWQPPQVSDNSETVEGAQIISSYFHHKMAEDPRIIIMGEDVGYLGGVNLEFQGLQKTYGDTRVSDTGIRELTILGQGHGAALRGFRPIVDIQYFDYLVYCVQGMTDDIASLHYRTNGSQVSPTIVRTKGHRLMGIWHAGSPLGLYLSSCRGMHICTPRNMVQAAGMYET